MQLSFRDFVVALSRAIKGSTRRDLLEDMSRGGGKYHLVNDAGLKSFEILALGYELEVVLQRDFPGFDCVVIDTYVPATLTLELLYQDICSRWGTAPET